MSLRPSFLPLLLLIATACSSAGVKGGEFGALAAHFGGFPPQTFEGIVHASASFGDYEQDLGIDLLDAQRVVPVKLKVLLRGEGQDTAQIQAIVKSMNLRLFLPDGTCIPPVSVDDVVAHTSNNATKRIRQASFRGDLLGVEPIVGYVFFSLEPSSAFEIKGRTIKHKRNGILRTMDAADSLLSFDLEVDSLSQPFFVGLQR